MEANRTIGRLIGQIPDPWRRFAAEWSGIDHLLYAPGAAPRTPDEAFAAAVQAWAGVGCHGETLIEPGHAGNDFNSWAAPRSQDRVLRYPDLDLAAPPVAALAPCIGKRATRPYRIDLHFVGAEQLWAARLWDVARDEEVGLSRAYAAELGHLMAHVYRLLRLRDAAAQDPAYEAALARRDAAADAAADCAAHWHLEASTVEAPVRYSRTGAAEPD